MPTLFVKSVVDLAELPKGTKPHIALVGRSNVGKSSLLNHLTQEKNLARVSAQPGRTQTINLFDIDGRFFLVDLPGYGFAKTSKANREQFNGMIHDYLWLTQQLKLVLLIIDARIGLTELDRAMLHELQSGRIPLVVVLNKIDKLSKSELATQLRTIHTDIPDVSLLPHSNVTGKGRGEIWHHIERAVRT